MNRPKKIGTNFESAVVKYLQGHGFGGAERRALAGSDDKGDILVCPGVIAECKGGHKAEDASDAEIISWLEETETERVNAGADFGFLVVKRKGHGEGKKDGWHVYSWTYWLPSPEALVPGQRTPGYMAFPIRLRLADAVTLLRTMGYGDPVCVDEEVAS